MVEEDGVVRAAAQDRDRQILRLRRVARRQVGVRAQASSCPAWRDPGTSRAASRTAVERSGEAEAANSRPSADASTLMQTTAFCRRSFAYCSPHSVEPVSVYSSASHSPMTIVRRGRYPSARQAARGRARGSASTPFPRRDPRRRRSRRRSGWRGGPSARAASEPRSVAMTFRIVRLSRVFSIFRWTRTGPGPTRNVSATARPCQPASGTARPPSARRGSRPRRGTRAASSGSSAGSRPRRSGCACASGVDAQPGVSGSPGTRKS